MESSARLRSNLPHVGTGLRVEAASVSVQDPSHAHAIEQSHERCVALGVSRIDAPDFSHIARADLTVALERNRRLHTHAAPVMALLHDQIARTESMVLLTDSVGTIIHAVGDDEFLDRADKVALRPGANWSEGAKGTNAIGTALVDETPTLVHADEHFLHANQFLTCSAAPILDPRGQMLGVLDVSGDFRSYHQHTLALVRMSARMIENRWLTEDLGDTLRLHFHSRAEYIGTYMEGLLAVGEDGRVLGANRSALEQLGLSGAAVRMQNLQALFGVSVGQLVDHARSHRLATALELVAINGRAVFAFARCNWPAWMATPIKAHGPLATGIAAPSENSAIRLQVGPSHPKPSSGPGLAMLAPTASPEPARTGHLHEMLHLADLCTGDPVLEAAVAKVRRVLDRDIPILLQGETGTGKALVARAIHNDSARGKQPFVQVNCASVPAHQLEAELLGVDEQGFSGGNTPRRRSSVGKALQAHGGTLFLNEVGALSPNLQTQLLRVLQEKQVCPLGAARAVPVDLAIVCANRQALQEQVAAGQFREDLYYRLNGLTVRLPALRERVDLLALVQTLLAKQSAGEPRSLSHELRGWFMAYAWPGNVRQLFQVLRAACAVAGPEAVLQAQHLPDDISQAFALLPSQAQGTPAGHETPAQASTLEEVERQTIVQALQTAGGNISQASKALGVSRNTIYRKLRWNAPPQPNTPTPT